LTAAESTYAFEPHERPLMPGSPATPQHPMPRRVGYFAIGVLISLSSGFANAALAGNLPQIQGALGLTSPEAAWLSAAYSIGNVCTSFILVKFRQQFGLQRLTRIFLPGFVALCGAQLFVHTYGLELALRTAAGAVASGFTPLGFFYIMQAMPAKARLAGMIMGVGLGQVALPLTRVISPSLLTGGEIQTLFELEFGLALLCLGAVALLRLPPSERAEVLEPLDFLTFALFAPGVALVCAVFAEARIVWWTTAWLGYALAGGLLLIGIAMVVEHNRANPLLNTRWLASRDMLRFAIIAATMRVLLSEQTFGSVGLLTLLGMGQDQLVTLYAIVTVATVAGLAASLLTLDPKDLIRPLLISLALIVLGALMDARATNLTRPATVYASQAIIAFAAIFFIGPTMMTGMLRALSKGPSHIVSYSMVFSMSQTVGGLAGASLLGTLQVVRERLHSNVLASSISLADPQVAARVQQLGGAYARVLGDPMLRQAQGAALLAQQVSREANILAYNDVFIVIAALAAAAFVWMGARWLVFRIRGEAPLAAELAALQALLSRRTG
jgi:MFS family permease